MVDLRKIIFFIAMVFAILLGLALLGKSQKGILAPYEPYQKVIKTDDTDYEFYYDTIFEFSCIRRINKPYKLITVSDKEAYMYSEPNFRTEDYGTYHEIDSLKCIRYKQMQWKMYYLDKLNEKDCN